MAPEAQVVREVRPRWPFRLPGFGGRDGILRAGAGTLARLLHVEGEPAVVGVRQPARDRVVFAASAADDRTAEEAIARMRFAFAVDDDLRPFYERFRFDPLLGRAVRARPELRVRRRPEPFEALAWAICEQLIEAQRAGGPLGLEHAHVGDDREGVALDGFAAGRDLLAHGPESTSGASGFS